MPFLLTKKDLIAFNQEFADGTLHNEASLDFALAYARRTANWPRALAYLVRAILADHAFEEGNKRTAALLVKSYAAYEGHHTYNDRLTLLIKDILLRNITDIAPIEEKIKNAIK